MIAVGGFLVGYYLGAKAGPKALDEIKDAWEVIQASDEYAAAKAGAVGFTRNFVGQSVRGEIEYGEMLSDLAGHVVDLIQRRGLRVVS